MVLSFLSCSSTKADEKMTIADALTEEDEEEPPLKTHKRRRSGKIPSFSLTRWFSRKSLLGSDSDHLIGPVKDASGGKHEDLSFSLGMGIGIGFQLAKSAICATELNKMMDLRSQMEKLLTEIRTDIRKKDAVISSSESSKTITIIDSCESSDNIFRGESNYATAFDNTRSESMDKMEAELQLELELLETNLNVNCSSVKQHDKEVENEKDEPSFESFSVTYIEDDTMLNDTEDYHGGVSAHELERRLHELLEARQQEQIDELQNALQRAEEKLREKEAELSSWKEKNCFSRQNEKDLVSEKV